MAATDQYKEAMHQLAPQGFVWPGVSEDSNIGNVWEAIGSSLLTADNDANTALDELFPDSTGIFLGDWERVLGFPRCDILGLTAQQRRDAHLAWLNISEFSDKDFFIEIAAIMGFTVSVYDDANRNDFLTLNAFFDSDTEWTKGTGWSISGGSASKVAGTASDLGQTIDRVFSGIDYYVKFTIENYVSGSITPTVGGTSGTAQSANGTYNETITAGGAGDVTLAADSSFVGDITQFELYFRIDPFVILVISTSIAPVTVFMVGQSEVGDKLVAPGSNASLECLIEFFAPAHTQPTFIYT
jgi:uncharacterized protein YmfQ (DUF2313 family)